MTNAKRFATSTFTDAGTGKTFTIGDHLDLDAGTLANYEAAGLASEKQPEAPKAGEASKQADGGLTKQIEGTKTA